MKKVAKEFVLVKLIVSWGIRYWRRMERGRGNSVGGRGRKLR